MKTNKAAANRPQSDAVTGLCASIAALVIALDEAGVLHRDRYEEILRHFWMNMPDNQTEGHAEAVIEKVLEFVDQYASDRTTRTFDLDELKRSLLNKATVSENSDESCCDESERKDRQSRHEPLLGAPFVV